MYFEIENTPEHLRKARKREILRSLSPEKDCPRLVLAPFSRPPQVVFDNVLIGSSCERRLEVFNPSKQFQQVTLGKALPPGLQINLPGEWLLLEPETCYCLTMIWSPMQPTALRETLRFTNENRGRYDVVLVLKSVMNLKGKSNQGKKSKVSPGKIKKATKRSPVAIYKKKAEVILKKTNIKKSVNVVHTTQYEFFDKENTYSEQSMHSNEKPCPFDSCLDFNFDTSEVFANMKQRQTDKLLQTTYEKPYSAVETENYNVKIPHNVLKPTTKQMCFSPTVDIFDNMSFTPLKSLPINKKANKNEKLNKGPKIILSVNSDSDFDDSLDIKNDNKENETHSIICISTSQKTNQWVSANNQWKHGNTQCTETPVFHNKKVPNTSSPKELNSPNFSINTDFSRISDLSFFPQRFSTERKTFPRVNNDTHEVIDDTNVKLNSETFTKDSPVTPFDNRVNQMYMEAKPVWHLQEQKPKMCRQALFKESKQQKELNDNKKIFLRPNCYSWNNDQKASTTSPPRSITPPLQSIPEESNLFYDTQPLDKTDMQTTTFTINRTFDKICDRSSMSSSRQSTWSKKAIQLDTDIWKIPAPISKKEPKKKSMNKCKISTGGKKSHDISKELGQNISYNTIGNVYSQSFTVDPFSSSTYFYDEEAVDKFENEFKRWLNYILTPPADLDSNVEQKIDVGKAWIENRNKEIPAAPTKEQVCSRYHNNHRLDSVRRAARTLLISPEFSKVLLKLNVQIEKKLIAIRNDKNLHLDVGLQKLIMEVLLSYNPLWLRIGLEAIYGLVLPLRSNSDVEGLTTFIIQRMFKNPHLKNKNSKSSAPNMLLPAYMEAIKKFTLKKFFMLVYFLDQAKQRKLISHDPCLFCRNAICKDSRDIIIRFTRELIAGIGDITKHLRPLGYVVTHKQSHLDEYKYAVHNIALDIRDGIRLTKVMEIILIKNGLLNQLRTPAISRLQKIHNVQVALNALKEANFIIAGDITATDIADGHREKTLSLLWQLIHVFRAPLFQKAANVIQTWWRKKYDVIIKEREYEEKIRVINNNAAFKIQDWWRRIQYKRLVKERRHQMTAAVIIIQKYCRMWICRTRLRRLKCSVIKISSWYKDIKMIREARETLSILKLQREELRRKSAVIVQSHVRRWLCRKQFQSTLRRIVLTQSVIRCFLIKRRISKLEEVVTFVQQKYRGKLCMRAERKQFETVKKSVICIQRYFRMWKQRKYYNKLKTAVNLIKENYKAILEMRKCRNRYIMLKKCCIKIQALHRSNKTRAEFERIKNIIIKLQRRVRANNQMKNDRANFLNKRTATIKIQNYVKSYMCMKSVRKEYIIKRQATIIIQRYFKSYLLLKSQQNYYIQLKKSTLMIQTWYRSVVSMRRERAAYLSLRNATIILQTRFRTQILMKECKNNYQNTLKATLVLQNRYRALKKMRKDRKMFISLRASCIVLQRAIRAYLDGKKLRQVYLKQKLAAIVIQTWFRSVQNGKEIKKQFEQSKQACVTIQRIYRAYVVGKLQRRAYLRTRTATVCIQRYFKSYLITKKVREEYLKIITSTVVIQRFYRSCKETQKLRHEFLVTKHAVERIQDFYRRSKETRKLYQEFNKLRTSTVCIQRWYRSVCTLRNVRAEYLKIRQAIIVVQLKYRALLTMKKERENYIMLKSAAITLQTRYRAFQLMKMHRSSYLEKRSAILKIQYFYRAHTLYVNQRTEYLKIKQAAHVIQKRYRAILQMQNTRGIYLKIRSSALTIQRRYRAQKAMIYHRNIFIKIKTACVTIQTHFKAYLIGKPERQQFLSRKRAVMLIQRRYREVRINRNIRKEYLQLRSAAVFLQRLYRYKVAVRKIAHNAAANKIQKWYISMKLRNFCRLEFVNIKSKTIILQSFFRMIIIRKRFIEMRNAAITIQRQYRHYKLAKAEREKYLRVRNSIVKVQSLVKSFIAKKSYMQLRTAAVTIQAAFRIKKRNDLLKAQREEAAICIQKYIRRYIRRSWYKNYIKQVIMIQQLWRGKLITRFVRCDYLQKRVFVIKLQAAIKGYLIRKRIEVEKKHLIKVKEEKQCNWAAAKIQALFRGHKARMAGCIRAKELRRRWRDGGLESTEDSLKDRNDEALDVLRNMSDIETVIRAFRSLELLTEVFPMMYNKNASSVVRRVYLYMSLTNRSVSSIEVLKSAASILVNLARYKITGPKIYARDRILLILKFMWRFSNSEVQLFCILSTYLWLFSKYEAVRCDLAEFLHEPENHKMLVTIKNNVQRMKRMTNNASRNKFSTPYHKLPSHMKNTSLRDSMNLSLCSNSGSSCGLPPALEPDYGIVRADRPRYFEDAEQAINYLFVTYKL